MKYFAHDHMTHDHMQMIFDLQCLRSYTQKKLDIFRKHSFTLTRVPMGGGYQPPGVFFVDGRREIWHDYSFILFTHQSMQFVTFYLRQSGHKDSLSDTAIGIKLPGLHSTCTIILAFLPL